MNPNNFVNFYAIYYIQNKI